MIHGASRPKLGVMTASPVGQWPIASHAEVSRVWPPTRSTAPKIAPHVPAMRAFLSPLLHVDPSRIAIKATTMEKLGAIGRKEGIMAHATVTVRLP